MKLFSTKEIARFDRYTIEHEPISSIALMERAASMVAYEVIARWGRAYKVIIFAGPGDNGGDGLALARLLSEEGYRGELFLFNPKDKLSADNQRGKERIGEATNFIFHEVVNEFLPPKLDAQTVVIDALFGVGLHSTLTGGFASLVEYVNDSEAHVVSVDIPSGLMGESNDDINYRYVVKAELTLTFQFPKLSFFFAENEPYVGEWMVLDIGTHPDIIEQTESYFHYTMLSDIAPLLTSRKRFASKHTMGHVKLFAGSRGMIGAAVLASQAVLQSGAGLLTLHTPQCGYTVLQSSVPEALVECDKHDNVVTVMPLDRNYAAVAVGPGLGRDPQTVNALHDLLRLQERSMVLDADALNILADNPQWLSLLPRNSIITPHVREFDRLFGESANSCQRLVKACEMARQHRLFIVLKGANSAVITPDNEVWFNSTGNAGMATAGSGDVLTGLLASLLAQGYTPYKASLLGVYLHGLAGDLVAAEWSQEGVTAGRVAAYLGKAFQRMRQQIANNVVEIAASGRWS